MTRPSKASSHRKRMLAVIVGLVALGLLVAPVVAYGSTTVKSASASVNTNEVAGTGTVDVSVQNQNVYTYAISRLGGSVHTSESGISKLDVAIVTVSLSLRTPSNRTLTLSILSMKGEGTRTYTVLLGPEEGLAQTGLFTLMISITVQVKTPSGQTQNTSFTLQRSFTIPQ